MKYSLRPIIEIACGGAALAIPALNCCEMFRGDCCVLENYNSFKLYPNFLSECTFIIETVLGNFISI